MARSEQIASLFAAVGFKIDQRSIQSLNKSLTTIEDRVNRIRDKMLGVGASKKNFGAAFKGMERQATGAATAIDTITKKFQNGLMPLQNYTTAAQSLAVAFAQIKANHPGRLPGIPRQRGQGGGSGGGGNRGARGQQQGFFAGAFEGLFGGGPSTFMRGLIPGLGAGWAVSHITQQARQMMATENAFSALSGSQRGGKMENQYAFDFANKYGLKYSEAADGYKRIMASSQGTAMQGKGARDIFEGVSLYGKTLGLSNEEMSRASTAISQMISKGKVSSEELKGQLAESLPGAVQIFAKAMDKPVAQMFKMMENGEVISEDILPKVAELLKEQAKAGGALEKALKSSASAQNRMTNQWSKMVKAIFEGGLDRALAMFFDSLTAIMRVLTAIPQPIWLTIAALGALKLAMMALPLVMLAKNFALISIIGNGGFWATAVLGVKALGAAFMTLGRMLFFQFLPVLLIIDTLEAFATGKKGLIRTGLEKSGVEASVKKSWAETQAQIKAESKAKNAAEFQQMYDQNMQNIKANNQMPSLDAIRARTQRDMGMGEVNINQTINGGDPKEVAEATKQGLREAFTQLQTSAAPTRGNH